MTPKLEYAKAGYYLEYLQHLNPELEQVANNNGIDLNWLKSRLFSFSYQYQFGNKHFAVIQEWTQIFSVYQNLLTRGIPTYPTYNIEKFLLENLLNFREKNENQSIIFRDELSGPQKNKLLFDLLRSHAFLDPHSNDFPINQDSDEERFFLQELAKVFGPLIFQIVESQRTFNSIIDDLGHEFYNQRADFSIETNKSKVIIEVDGTHHLVDGQTLLDKKRDFFLEKNNWKTIRIPASSIREKNLYSIIEETKLLFEKDPLLKFEMTNLEEVDFSALFVLLIPIAIARLQWVMNWVLLRGEINLEKSTIRIAVIEEDIPCAFLAIWDFLDTLEHFRNLTEINKIFPKINLDIFQDKNQFNNFTKVAINQLPKNNNLIINILPNDNKKSMLENEYDLVISNSIIHIGPKREFEQNIPNVVMINSVFSPRGVLPRYNSTKRQVYRCIEKTEDLKFFLNWIFRKKEFLPGQIEIINRSLMGKDIIGLLPTGAGKSLAYQMSALLQPGMTLIIDPIISLMNDQTTNLKQIQIDALASISSDHSLEERNEVMRKMSNRNLLLLFASPERLQVKEFRERLCELCQHTLIPFLVIDEAHCASEWGHDFRPSYLRLVETVKRNCQFQLDKPTVIALTGTASWDVLTAIQREIDVNEDEAIITPETFDRQELEFEIVKCESKTKPLKLMSEMLKLPNRFNISKEAFFNNENAGIVFCPHVKGDYGIMSVSSRIRRDLPELFQEIGVFGGTVPNEYNSQLWKETKLSNQERFKSNNLQLMVATKAFGMGIDKPNIRYTIHYNIPTSLEAFYQEAGRAGRDRKRAVCVIIFSGEPSEWKDKKDVPIEVLARNKRTFDSQDDLDRMIYLHGLSWQGIDCEFNNIMKIVNDRIEPLMQKLKINEKSSLTLLSGKNDEEKSSEKSIYRLCILGIICDYTIDFNFNQFHAEIIRKSDSEIISALLDYFSRYKPNEYRQIALAKIEKAIGKTVLEKCIRVLLEFVYSEIEHKRRRAIFQMAEVAETSSLSLEPFRIQLLSYLEKSEFTQLLIDLPKTIKPIEWANIASKAVDVDSARHLLGGCRRALESYPDHPGLLFLCAYSRLLIPRLPTNQATQEFEQAISILSKLNIKETVIALESFSEFISLKRPSYIDVFENIVLNNFPYRDIARSVIGKVSIDSEAGCLAVRILLTSLLEKTKILTAHMLEGGKDDGDKSDK